MTYRSVEESSELWSYIEWARRFSFYAYLLENHDVTLVMMACTL